VPADNIVCINKCDKFSLSMLQADVAGLSNTKILLLQKSYRLVLLCLQKIFYHSD